MAPKIRRHRPCINKPDRTKSRPIRKTQKSKSQSISNQTKKPCFADMHYLQKRPQCSYRNAKCKQSYASQTTLRRHILAFHKQQLSLQPPKSITTIDGSNYEHSGRGRPVIKGQHAPRNQLDDLIPFFMADFEGIFFQMVKQQRKREEIKGRIKVKEYAIYQDLLSTKQMMSLLKQAFRKLSTIKKCSLMREFRQYSIALIIEFVQQLILNTRPQEFQFIGPIQRKKSKNQKKYIEENDLEELINFQAQNNFFETKSEWSYFSKNFSQEFQSRIKKDLVIIAWASGVIRRDLFLEYFCFMFKLIETESRLHVCHYECSRRVKSQQLLSEQEYEKTIRMIEEEMKHEKGFKSIDTNWRKKLMDLRKDILNEIIREKIKVPKGKKNQQSTKTQA